MKLNTYYDGIELHRNSKIIYVRFLRPHRVLSSSLGKWGGMREELEYLYNHQCCEPFGHEFEQGDTTFPFSGENGLSSDKCTGLSTAANMNNAAVARAAFEGLEVVAVVTGGVATNAARAGDPGGYHQISYETETEHGTINIILCTNLELTPGAMVQAAITATEAKTSVLEELGVPSRYSDGYATGTGTDQIGIASMLGETKIVDTGKHSKTGELIGTTVREALQKTLGRQDGLHPAGQCSVFKQIERFGITCEEMKTKIPDLLDTEAASLYHKNADSIDRDPHTVAAVAAVITIRDKCVWGILPLTSFAETALPYFVQIAVTVSGENDRRSFFEEELQKETLSIDNRSLLDSICRSISLGFSYKWKCSR
jgi:adenosylcobinamide amidohydrolase